MEASEGSAVVTAKAGDADIAGTVSGKTAATVTATGGDAKVSGTVTSESAAKVESTDKAVEISGAVAATGEGATAEVVGGTSATVTDAGKVEASQGSAVVTANAGDADIAGTVTAATNATVTATGMVSVTETGTVAATAENGLAKIESTGAGVSISGAVQAEAESSDVLLLARGGDLTLNGSASAGQNLTADASGDIKVLANQSAGKDMALVAGKSITVENVQLSAGDSLVMKALEKDLDLTASTLSANNIGLEAGEDLDAGNATFDAQGVTLLKAKDLLNLKGTQAGTLGLVSQGDIRLDSLTVNKLAAKSTAGSVSGTLTKDVELVNLGNAGVKAERADGEEDVSVKVEGGLNGLQATKKDVTLDAKNVKGSQIVGGSSVNVQAGNISLSNVEGGTVNITSGNTDIGTVKAGGTATLQTGNLTVKELSSGGLADINSSNLKFDRMTAGTADIDAKGSIQMGALTTKKADITASGSISDNNSHVKTDTLTMKAGGDIGSSGKPIELESSKIESVSGKNVYLLESSSGKTVYLGRIDASGRVELAAPRIGLPHGKEGGFLPLHPGELNIHAPGGLLLKVDGYFGKPGPGQTMKVDARGEWAVESAELHGNGTVDVGLPGSPLDYIYMIFTDSTPVSDGGALPVYRDANNGAIPGLIIYNGRPVQGHPDLLRKIYSALAFTADTPELKSTQGVFGSPLFLHTDLALTEMGAYGLVDYLSFSTLTVPRPLVTDLRRATVMLPGEDEPVGLLNYWKVDEIFRTLDALKKWENQPAIYRVPHASSAGTSEAKK